MMLSQEESKIHEANEVPNEEIGFETDFDNVSPDLNKKTTVIDNINLIEENDEDMFGSLEDAEQSEMRAKKEQQ